MTQLRALGSIELLDNKGRTVRLRSRKHLALLLYLASGARRTYDRGHLCRLLWATPEAQARHSLSQALYDLTQCLGPIVVRGTGTTVGLDHALIAVDVSEFELALKQGSLREAVDLFRGAFAEDLVSAGTEDFERWLDGERYRLSQLGEMALRRFVESCESQAQWGEMCIAALRLTEMAPFDEGVHRTVMRAFWIQGEAASALQYFETRASFMDNQPSGGISVETLDLVERIRASPRHQIADTLEPTESQFVGRESEFAMLRRVFESLDFGATQTVTIQGDAGIGKTRLMEEFMRSLRAEPVRMLESRCYKAEEDHPYSAVVDGLGPLIKDIGNRSSLISSLDGVRRLLPGAIGSESDHSGVTADATRRQLYDEVVRLLEVAAAATPVVWCIDDVQWLDKSSAALLHYVARRLTESRLLLVLTIKNNLPSPEETAPTSGSKLFSTGPMHEIQLGSLSDEEIRDLLTRTFPEVRSHPVLDLATRLGAGNPSNGLEVLRAATSSENWTKSATRWDPLDDEQLRRVFAVRLAGLDHDQSQMLRAIAVLGRHARPSLVGALTGQTLGELASHSQELYRRALVIDETDCTTYSNDSIKEFVISQMTRIQAAHLHMKAGEILRHEPGVPAGVLATHFYLGDDWSRCYGYAMEAATSAQNSGANTEAAHYAKVASRVAPGLDEMKAALRTQGDALFAVGDLTAAAECFSQILGADLPASAEEHAKTLLSLSATRIEGCDWAAAATDLRDSKARISVVPNLNTAMCLHAEHAALSLKLALRTGDQQAMLELDRHLASLVEDLAVLAEPEPETALSIEMAVAVHKTFTISSYAAAEHLSRAYRYARMVSPKEEMRYLALRGLVRTRMAEWDAAQADFVEAKQVASQLGDNVALIRLWNNLACVSLGLGDWGEAGSRLRQAEAIQGTISATNDLSIPVALNNANLAFYQGQLTEAADRYAGVEGLCRKQQSLEYVDEVVSCQGLVALQRGDRSSAGTYWDELRVIRGKIGPSGSQERFKVAWFEAAMCRDRPNDVGLLETASVEESKDVPGHLKLLMLDAILSRRAEVHFSEIRSKLQGASMGWFSHFARRWYRMTRTS